MTAKEVRFIERQLHKIHKKANEEELNKHFSSLMASSLDDEVKQPLLKGVDVHRCILRAEPPMAVNGDLDDIN